MSDRKDDTAPIPAPSAPADDLERKRAERFGELISDIMGGESLPPAMDPDDRALARVASMIRASTSEVSLSSNRADAIISETLERTTKTRRPPSISSLPAVSDDSLPIELGRKKPKRRVLSVAPWALTAVAAAAAVVLWVSRPAQPATVATPSAKPAPTLSSSQRSRPTDALVGAIARTDSGLASSRIDVIYADRLDGYRSLALSTRSPRGVRRD